MPVIAQAQASPYNTTTTGTINGSIDCAGTTRLTRTINVPDSFIISDLDVGFLASHSWRGDIGLDISHGGVTATVITTDTSAAANEDNYNVRLNDGSATLIRTAPHNTNDGLTAPPYENDVRPNNPLSVFNGQNANGTWTLSMCDAFPGSDNGQFSRADLYFQSTSLADLSFDLTTPSTSPPEGSDITLTAMIDNGGPETDPVTFTETGTSGLSFTCGSDVAFSNSATKLVNFAACSYSPAAGYDHECDFCLPESQRGVFSRNP